MRAGNRDRVQCKRRRGDKLGGLRLLGLKAPMSEEAQTSIGVKNHFALKALWNGVGSHDDIVRVAHALNVGLVLCELGVGEKYLPEVQAAQNALVGIATRSRELGRWTLNEVEYRAICAGLEVHDAQLELASVKEIATAEEEIVRRASHGDVISAKGVS